MDYAIRRRFFFIDFVANDRILEAYLSTTKSKIERNLVIGFFNEINHSILNDEKLGKHYQLGHSYFMKPGLDEKMLRRIWKYSIKPILEEYYFEDYAQLEKFENSLKVIIPDRNSMSS